MSCHVILLLLLNEPLWVMAAPFDSSVQRPSMRLSRLLISPGQDLLLGNLTKILLHTPKYLSPIN